MNIIYISKYFNAPSDSETGSRGFHLCRELTRLGHEVKVLASKPPHIYGDTRLNKVFNKNLFEKLEVIFIKTINFLKKRSASRIISWIEFEIKCIYFIATQKNKPDLIISSSLSLLSILTGLIFKTFYKVKVIFEVRDIWPLSAIEIGGFSKFNPLILLLSAVEKLGYKYSDAIVGTMPNLSEHVKSIVKKHPPVYCIPMGISEEHEKTLNQTQKNNPDVDFDFIPSKKFIVGYAGAFGAANALHYFLDAAKDLESTNIHFVFVGEGDLKIAFKEKYEHLPNITIGPRLKKHDVPRFLKKCDLLTFATNPAKIYKYGHSVNKVIDYMLAGKPCLGIYDGHDEMITKANCGFLLKDKNAKDIANKIHKISQLPPIKLNEMGENGKIWVESNRKFSTLGKEYDQILASLKD